VRVYYDPSCLIALYLTEPLSSAIRAFVEKQNQPVLVNQLQELEFRNGLRQKVLRKEIAEQHLAQSLRLFDDDAVAEKILRKQLVWSAVYAQAEAISHRWSTHQTCRSFDLLHVAVAVVSNVRQFATADGGQAELARTVGLKVFDFSR
jgi:predicted nucleic acid-binding protein